MILTHVDLFSGIGGFSLAADWAGFTTTLFCERNPYCQNVLARHWPGVPIHDDISTLTAFPHRHTDLLTGGFPCQPFSVAGRQRGTADDRHLWPQMLRVIQAVRPTWICGENVAGFVRMALDDVCADLEAAGYEAWPLVFPACGVGAWHRRERVFVIAHDANAASLRGVAIERHESNRDVSGDADAADAESGGLRRGEAPGQGGQPAQSRQDVPDADREPPGWFAEPWREHSLWESEPAVGRVAHGVPRRVDRLRALGNAVVPQQAYVILKAIADEIRANQ